MGPQNIFMELILLNCFKEFTLLVLYSIGMLSPYSSNNTHKANVYYTSMGLSDLFYKFTYMYVID